ncbi:MAG TPA: TfoX/Sxy family protein [Egibacteraceae bacterium]|nr:TfoX/Sxy family protein [Egibacteraceae bacterium]
MAYDEALAERVREAIAAREALSERKMFGGIAWMLHGNMAVGIVGEDLMVRVGPQAYESALREPHARPMDFTGRPMNGYVFVAAPGLTADQDLAAWVARGAGFAETLPPK